MRGSTSWVRRCDRGEAWLVNESVTLESLVPRALSIRRQDLKSSISTLPSVMSSEAAPAAVPASAPAVPVVEAAPAALVNGAHDEPAKDEEEEDDDEAAEEGGEVTGGTSLPAAELR